MVEERMQDEYCTRDKRQLDITLATMGTYFDTIRTVRYC